MYIYPLSYTVAIFSLPLQTWEKEAHSVTPYLLLSSSLWIFQESSLAATTTSPIHRIHSNSVLPFTHIFFWRPRERVSHSLHPEFWEILHFSLLVPNYTPYNSLLPFTTVTSPCRTFFVSCSSVTCITFFAPLTTTTWVIRGHWKYVYHITTFSLDLATLNQRLHLIGEGG